MPQNKPKIKIVFTPEDQLELETIKMLFDQAMEHRDFEQAQRFYSRAVDYLTTVVFDRFVSDFTKPPEGDSLKFQEGFDPKEEIVPMPRTLTLGIEDLERASEQMNSMGMDVSHLQGEPEAVVMPEHDEEVYKDLCPHCEQRIRLKEPHIQCKGVMYHQQCFAENGEADGV